MNRTETHNGYEYIFEDFKVGDEKVTLSANDQAWVSLFVDELGQIDLPLVHEGELTMCLTPAGLTAIEDIARQKLRQHGFYIEDAGEIEINGNANDNLCGNCEGCENNGCDEEEDD